MYKLLIVWSFVLMAACAPTIKSVVGEEVGKKAYSNTLIINPAAEAPSNSLKKNLEMLFADEKRKVEIVVFEQKQEELKLNSAMEIYSVLNDKVRQDEKDLIIVFRTRTIQVFQGEMQTATFMVAATDAATHKEIWKAECVSDNFYNSVDFGKKTAAAIYEKLKSDKVL